MNRTPERRLMNCIQAAEYKQHSTKICHGMLCVTCMTILNFYKLLAMPAVQFY